MRKIIQFNHNWGYLPDYAEFDVPENNFEPITLPHTNKVFPHNNFDNQAYQFVSTYRKAFHWDEIEEGMRVFLDFEGVMLACSVFLNGTLLAEHKGGFAPFSVDLTETLQPGENTLTVYVDSRERDDIPPYGHLVDYLTFGGIYREVALRIVPATFIEDVFVKTENILTTPQLTVDVTLNQPAKKLTAHAQLMDQQGNVLLTAETQASGTELQFAFEQLPDIKLWTLDDPVLYTIKTTISGNEQIADSVNTRFGFREAEFRPDGGFYLNGERLNLFGLDRHQTYPYIGGAAPRRLQRLDAEILKNDLACNIVRTSHYPQSRHFLDRCDEIGLLVFEEVTGWQHIGDEDWQAITLEELETTIKRDRNRPSIVLWGVRINESPDNDAFYTKTNALAHKLDPTRQTGGVRCFLGSNLLEDVYTYNDFSNTVIDPPEQPYLITEFAGHMFPTKIWDNEDRLIEHALLHTMIQDRQMGNPKIAGAIGWCAFDYATHKEFGSGDRICYHGVMDIFRLPKWAAAFYRSQQDPAQKVVLQAATHWTMGDRSGGGNDPLTVFSNCDEVEVIIGENNLGRFSPDSKTYPNLAHPPFTIPILEKFSAWGQSEFYDLQLIGYLDNKPIAEQWIASNQLPTKLLLAVDTPELHADGADMTRLIFRITDAYGNPLPYATKVVHFDLKGPAELIGENPFPLVGGQAAVFIRAGDQPGKVTTQVTAAGLPSEKIEIEVVDIESN
ncbi:glycoside hydrolase family 2 protein [bacterium]|nr:glycoside hydrolase family 2 protein [bacterium]